MLDVIGSIMLCQVLFIGNNEQITILARGHVYNQYASIGSAAFNKARSDQQSNYQIL